MSDHENSDLENFEEEEEEEGGGEEEEEESGADEYDDRYEYSEDDYDYDDSDDSDGEYGVPTTKKARKEERDRTDMKGFHADVAKDDRVVFLDGRHYRSKKGSRNRKNGSVGPTRVCKKSGFWSDSQAVRDANFDSRKRNLNAKIYDLVTMTGAIGFVFISNPFEGKVYFYSSAELYDVSNFPSVRAIFDATYLNAANNKLAVLSNCMSFKSKSFQATSYRFDKMGELKTKLTPEQIQSALPYIYLREHEEYPTVKPLTRKRSKPKSVLDMLIKGDGSATRSLLDELEQKYVNMCEPSPPCDGDENEEREEGKRDGGGEEFSVLGGDDGGGGESDHGIDANDEESEQPQQQEGEYEGHDYDLTQGETEPYAEAVDDVQYKDQPQEETFNGEEALWRTEETLTMEDGGSDDAYLYDGYDGDNDYVGEEGEGEDVEQTHRETTTTTTTTNNKKKSSSSSFQNSDAHAKKRRKGANSTKNQIFNKRWKNVMSKVQELAVCSRSMTCAMAMNVGSEKVHYYGSTELAGIADHNHVRKIFYDMAKRKKDEEDAQKLGIETGEGSDFKCPEFTEVVFIISKSHAAKRATFGKGDIANDDYAEGGEWEEEEEEEDEDFEDVEVEKRTGNTNKRSVPKTAPQRSIATSTSSSSTSRRKKAAVTATQKTKGGAKKSTTTSAAVGSVKETKKTKPVDERGDSLPKVKPKRKRKSKPIVLDPTILDLMI